MLKRIATCALLLTAVLFFGTACDKKVVMTEGLPSIMGTVTVDSGSGGVTTSAYVSVDGTRLLPVVAVSKDTLDVQDYSSSGEYLWSSSWGSDRLHVTQGDSCVLHVYQSNGEATTDGQVIPNIPKILTPSDTFILGENQSLSVTWVTTEGVDRYEIEFYVHYYYRGDYDYVSLDTIVTLPAGSSSYTLPGTVIFPSYVDSVSGGYCDITIRAETGPNIGHESEGNISGNGCGYFFTSSDNASSCFIASRYKGPNLGHPGPSRPTARQLVERKKALLANQ